MRKFTVLLILLLTLTAINLKGQKLSQVDGNWGTKYFQDDKKISYEQFLIILRSEERSVTLAKKSVRKKVTGTIIAFPAGFALGYPLGLAAAGGDFDVGIFGLGVILTTASIALSRTSEQLLKKSVKAYNEGLPSSALEPSYHKYFSLLSNAQGLGLAFNF